MNGIAVDLTKVSQVTSEGAKQLEAFGRGVFSAIVQIWMGVWWLSKSFRQESRLQKLNEMRRLLVAPRSHGSCGPSTLFWESVRYASISFVGGVNAFALFVRGIRFETTYEHYLPLTEPVLDWEGRHRSLDEQVALILWYTDRGLPLRAYKLADGYKPRWERDLDGCYRQVPLKHVELAELHMLKAVAAFRSGKHPLHSVLQAAKRSVAHGSKWSFDEDLQESLARFIVIQMRLGDLLFQVAEKWPDATAKTAPFLNKDNKHVLELARSWLTGALECASGKDAHQEPKVRKIMQKHGLLEAA